MKLIVGLGNPGRKYEQTRHNVGFMVAAKLAHLVAAGPAKIRFEGEVSEAVADEKLVLLCPHTYMNASGKSVRKAFDFYKLDPGDLLVICDDLNLPAGRLRARAGGSAGGQKGLADIIRHLGTDQFCRLRIGIDRPPPGWDTTDYVLGKFSPQQHDKIGTAIDSAAHATLMWANEGIAAVMNRYNADPSAKPKEKKAGKKSPDRDSPDGTTVTPPGSDVGSSAAGPDPTPPDANSAGEVSQSDSKRD